MELHDLKCAPTRRKQRKRTGRGPGSGTGKTCGRGHKGQKSRSGYSRHWGDEGGQMPLHRRLPKRGFNHRKRWPMDVVNVDDLNQCFEDGDEVTPAIMLGRGLVEPMPGGVKLLGGGEITKKLAIHVQAASPSARAKVEAAGGTVEILPGPKGAGSAVAPVVEDTPAPVAESEAEPAGAEAEAEPEASGAEKESPKQEEE